VIPGDSRAIELIAHAARAADRVKAHAITALDVSGRLALTDAFLLVSGNSERQVGGIVDEVDEALARIGAKADRREGVAQGRWVLLDYGDAIVHVQHAEDRQFYGLDRLWKDCPVIPLPGIGGGQTPGQRSVSIGSGALTSAGAS